MYSKELEEFIDLILADGEISDKERAVLHKKAIAEGVDVDEIDIVVDGRLAKMQKAQTEKMKATASPIPTPPPAAPAPRQSSKFGVVEKCPQCGAVVEAGVPKCKECGYAFRGIEAVSSVVKFSEMLQQIEKESSSNLLTGVASLYGFDSRTRRKHTAIQNFPIPNSKEDLLEFYVFLKPKTKGSNNVSDNYLKPAYKQKFKECQEKLKMYFGDDPDVRQILGLDKKSFLGGLFGKK